MMDEGLSARMRMLVADIRAQWQELDRRIAAFDAEFVRWAKENEDARRLITIPGVGVTISTALIAADRQSRDFRAWSRSCGMAGPGSASVDNRRQATADGDQQTRKQVSAQAADPWSTSGTAHVAEKDTALGRWAKSLLSRVHQNVAVVAFANKLARICWAVLRNGQKFAAKGAPLVV